ncbi:hypothetical protein KTR66_14495 [Roseococcus sp. SDR]|uniref:hypothetical protein n=1 Tax=Roseococcus sp. SDR TaxID=2835532 RepID=UPI001BCA88E6|nr:hypothetical protein [Roseococcus sp. SDR]MBS7791210.1 hypothetical protein [Roseococcus sp. SDR]MBV1846524.1 hypothetical protein [Roseococcus sp. SDR]
MSAELRGASLYVLAAFGLGFLLGPLREFVLAPRIGRVAALLLELPLMLGFCAWIAPRLLRRCRVPPGRARLRMGFTALLLLLALEFFAGVALRGWDLRAWLAQFTTPPGLVTLLGYLVFALIPRWVRTP